MSSSVAPSKSSTVPIGVGKPPVTAETVTVNATDWPKTEVGALEVTATVVSAVVTVWPPARVVLLSLKLPSALT